MEHSHIQLWIDYGHILHTKAEVNVYDRDFMFCKSQKYLLSDPSQLFQLLPGD